MIVFPRIFLFFSTLKKQGRRRGEDGAILAYANARETRGGGGHRKLRHPHSVTLSLLRTTKIASRKLESECCFSINKKTCHDMTTGDAAQQQSADRQTMFGFPTLDRLHTLSAATVVASLFPEKKRQKRRMLLQLLLTARYHTFFRPSARTYGLLPPPLKMCCSNAVKGRIDK